MYINRYNKIICYKIYIYRYRTTIVIKNPDYYNKKNKITNNNNNSKYDNSKYDNSKYDNSKSINCHDQQFYNPFLL